MKSSKAATDYPQSLLHFRSSSPFIKPSALVGDYSAPAALFYEPTSVLDHHLTSSPAPASAAEAALPPLQWDATPPPDDWDTVDSWLLPDDDPSIHFMPPPPHGNDLDLDFPPPPFDRAHLDLLLRAAQAVDSGDLGSAQLILARLNLCLPAPAGSPLQRAAFYFKEALQSLPLRPPAPLSAAGLVRRVAAHKAFSDLSPIPQFLGFSANQALLEALPADAPALHVIDFDLGLGGQWSSFAQEVVARSTAARRALPRVRLTAVVPEGDACDAEARLAADNLRDFAAGLGLRLSVDLVRLATLEFGAVRLSSAEPAAVVLSPALLSCTPGSSAAILRFVRRVLPRVIVFVDTECCCSAASSSSSLNRSFLGGLEHYSALMESLDAAAAAAGAGEEPVRRVECAIIRPEVAAAVGAWAGSVQRGSWEDLFTEAGWTQAPVSAFAESQAEWLLRRLQVDGFHVDTKEGAMVLSWKGRELASTSAWRC